MQRIRPYLYSIAVGWLLVASTVQGADGILRLATTTSTENSGLLAKLVPGFTESRNIPVHVIAVGTGRALNHARNGDVDVVLVHAEKAELKLVESGFGINRKEVMFNEFVIVGPSGDPAGVHGLTNLGDAFRKIAQSGELFISRGDDSGTHKRELEIWDKTQIEPMGEWYKEVGLGMGRALQIADELRAYILTDKGTWLALKRRLNLPVHVQGADDGRNVYGIIAVNPRKHPQVNADAAQELIDWIGSDEAKTIIAGHQVEGEPLFYVVDETLHD